MESLTRLVVIAAFTAGCLPDAKETLELPPTTSPLTAERIGQLTDGMLDVRNVTTTAGRLYVADESGLLVFDTSSAGTPVLLGAIRDARVDHVAVHNTRAYLIDVGGEQLREWDVADPSAPTLLASERSLTRTFGGLDVSETLVWHAVGSSPPSRLFYESSDLKLASSCLADDRERGIMSVWLYPGLVILAIHFDDFAGDGLSGNGAFGFALLELRESPGSCPTTDVRDIVLAPSHGLNRSEFEEPTNSDLQATFDVRDRSLYLTGEQRLRRHRVRIDATTTLLDEIVIPELLDVALDTSVQSGPVLGLANGDFVIVDARRQGGLDFATQVETPGVARAVAAAGDGVHWYAADGEAGVAIIEVREP